MKTSVIIPTYNRADKIGNLLDSLLNQTVNDFEVIVVVDGSTDSTVEVVEPYKNRFTQFKLMVNQNQGRSKTRNAGANVASGDLLIFYDDDMMVDDDSVNRHIAFHKKYNQGIVLAGSHREQSGNTDIQKYREHLTPFWFSKYKERVTLMRVDNLFFSTQNCSITHRIFRQLNGFDERLHDGEDFDLATRALNTGISVFLDKDNMATHCDLITCKSYIKRQREYAIGREERNKINGVIRKQSLIKHLLYKSFAFNFWVKAIDKEWFVVLPKKMRYKLYDVVIHSLSVEYADVKLK